MKLVFVSFPTSEKCCLPEVRALFQEIRKKEEKEEEKKVIPMVPYLIAAEVHRFDLGARAASRLLLSRHTFKTMRPDELWLYGTHISPEMDEEIAMAADLRLPIIPQSDALRQKFRLQQFRSA